MAYVDANRLRRSATLANSVSRVLDDDDLLVEIMVRLGYPTSLVRSALVCKRWFRQASDPSFLRRFRRINPPLLLGFYINTTRSDLESIGFVPMLQQPPELASVIHRASFILDSKDKADPYFRDCLNGRVAIYLVRYGSTPINVVHNPLFPETRMVIVPPIPHNPSLSSPMERYHLLLKEFGAGLSSFYVVTVCRTNNIKSVVHVYMLQDGDWCMCTSATIGVPCEQLQEPLLVDNKIYILTFLSGILVLDLVASSVSTIKLPDGVVYGNHFSRIHPPGLECRGRTMLSRADNGSGVYLIHVSEHQLGMWLQKGCSWLMVDRISLNEMCGGLNMSDCMVRDEHSGFVEITKVGPRAEFVLLKAPRCLFHWDVKCRTLRKVYEATTKGYGLYDAHPFMMIWPPAFPKLKNDTASKLSFASARGAPPKRKPPMAPRKRPRYSTTAPIPSPENAATWGLPADLLLEILVRTDLFTLVHCAATCKLLRSEILSSAPFIHNIAQQTAPCILTHPRCSDKPLTLVHPATPAAASFCHDKLSPFMLRKARQVLLGRYDPVTSRRGLVLLMHRGTVKRPKSKRSTDLCVYDPMTGRRQFLPKPTGIRGNDEGMENYVLLTAADGIPYSFMLFVADLCKRIIYVQTITSCSRTWRAVTTYPSHPRDFPWWSVGSNRAPAVLNGGIIHWLAHPSDIILTYDVLRKTMGKVKLPPNNRDLYELHLATSDDGNLLKLITIEGFTISVWLQPPTVPTGGGQGWSLVNRIDIEEKLRSLCPHIHPGVHAVAKFEGFGQRTGDVVLLQIAKKGCTPEVLVLDLKKNEMHKHEWVFTLLEIDLPSRLKAMKMFS